MSDWNPQAGPNPPGDPPPLPPVLGPVGGVETKPCFECGKVFSTQDMIRHGDNYVCVNCKPIFMQKLAEGLPLESLGLRYAGFWIRFAAYFIDIIILSFVAGVVGFFFGLGMFAAMGAPSPAKIDIGLMLLNFLFTFVLRMIYETVCVGKWGATPGKLACKLKVVTAEGEKVAYARAFGRFFGKLLSDFTLYIGYIMAAFDPEKQALHDRICNTRVIYT
jgi:uncharacterized RDD family membrane protein YckC